MLNSFYKLYCEKGIGGANVGAFLPSSLEYTYVDTFNDLPTLEMTYLDDGSPIYDLLTNPVFVVYFRPSGRVTDISTSGSVAPLTQDRNDRLYLMTDSSQLSTPDVVTLGYVGAGIGLSYIPLYKSLVTDPSPFDPERPELRQKTVGNILMRVFDPTLGNGPIDLRINRSTLALRDDSGNTWGTDQYSFSWETTDSLLQVLNGMVQQGMVDYFFRNNYLNFFKTDPNNLSSPFTDYTTHKGSYFSQIKWTTGNTSPGQAGPTYNQAQTITPGSSYTTSIYVRSNQAVSMFLQVKTMNASSVVRDTLTSSGVVLVPGQWTRLSVSGVLAGTDVTKIEIKALSTSFRFNTNDTVDVCDLMFEESPTLKDYFDGTYRGDSKLLYSWAGAVNNSVSYEDNTVTGIRRTNQIKAPTSQGFIGWNRDQGTGGATTMLGNDGYVLVGKGRTSSYETYQMEVGTTRFGIDDGTEKSDHSQISPVVILVNEAGTTYEYGTQGTLMNYRFKVIAQRGVKDQVTADLVSAPFRVKAFNSQKNYTRHFKLTDDTKFLPFVHYRTGDWVYIRNRVGTWVRVRIQQISLTRDSNGVYQGYITFGDMFDEAFTLFMKRLQKYYGGNAVL